MAKQQVNWRVVKGDWIKRNMTESVSVTLTQVAKENGVSYERVKTIAERDTWQGDLEEAINQRDSLVLAELQERSRKAVTAVQDRYAESETRVRLRHADWSRALQSMGRKALETIKPEDLTPREALEFIKVGITEERRALGLPDKVLEHEFKEKSDDVVSPDEVKKGLLKLLDLSAIEGEFTDYGDHDGTDDDSGVASKLPREEESQDS